MIFWKKRVKPTRLDTIMKRLSWFEGDKAGGNVWYITLREEEGLPRIPNKLVVEFLTQLTGRNIKGYDMNSTGGSRTFAFWEENPGETEIYESYEEENNAEIKRQQNSNGFIQQHLR